MSAHLYELAEARDILDSFLAETEGEETPELRDLFEQLEGEVAAKVENTTLYIFDLEADAEKLKLEEQRLAARRKALETRANGMRRYLAAKMEQLGLDKVKGLRASAAFQNAGPVLEVDESIYTPDVLPEFAKLYPEFVTTKPATYALNKPTLLQALKAGRYAGPGLAVRVPRYLRLR